MRRDRDKDRGKDQLRINREIRVPQVRVIDENGEMLGVFTVPEAIRLAEDKGLDLIEIAPTASPPTCKIMDYGKYKYENKKKQAAARKKQVIVTVKELQLRPRTDQHDLETKLKHARRFILDGDKVKVNLRFMGREMAHQELGVQLLNKVIQGLQDISILEVPPKFEGKQMYLILSADAVKVKEYLKLHPKVKGQEELPPLDKEDISETQESVDAED
jgi:translation initiation factor IF-3